MRAVIIATGFFVLLSCGPQDQHIDARWLPQSSKTTIVVLQPLSYVPGNLLAMLKDSIPKYYPVTVHIASIVEMPVNAYYKPRNRYRADTILAFLNKSKPTDARLVAGITREDISVRKGAVADWGIMGFGYQPGYASVVSTYRLQKDNPSEKLFMQRLLKTVLHEMGHNFGLPHCSNEHCIMADAKGKLNQDNESSLCEDCRKKIKI